MPSGDELVGISFPSGVKNVQYGVWKSRCCGTEIVLYSAATFPMCSTHKEQATEWAFVTSDLLQKPNSPRSPPIQGKEPKMARQERALTDDEIRRITGLLSQTDMSISEIADRMRCSRSAVLSFNRKLGIRKYNLLKATWEPHSSHHEKKTA